MKFYLGTHKDGWLKTTTIPLFISNRQLRIRKTLPFANYGWALDSGGFSELSLYGEWRTSSKDYYDLVQLYKREVGSLEWAAIQDYMCEPFIIEKTKLSVLQHQSRTIDSFIELHSKDQIFIPIIQGFTIDEYKNHIQMYQNRGIDLTSYKTVGIGSVCRRQGSQEILDIVKLISSYGINLHGFGVKIKGLKDLAQYLTSADSMAWSYSARYKPPLSECTHRNCANCKLYAYRWYDKIKKLI